MKGEDIKIGKQYKIVKITDTISEEQKQKYLHYIGTIITITNRGREIVTGGPYFEVKENEHLWYAEELEPINDTLLKLRNKVLGLK